MVGVSISENGVDYKDLYIKGRLRKYSDIKTAINGATHLIYSPSRKLKSIRLYDSETKEDLVYVRTNDLGEVLTEYKKPKDELFKDIKPSEKKEGHKKNKMAALPDLSVEDHADEVEENNNEEKTVLEILSNPSYNEEDDEDLDEGMKYVDYSTDTQELPIVHSMKGMDDRDNVDKYIKKELLEKPDKKIGVNEYKPMVKENTDSKKQKKPISIDSPCETVNNLSGEDIYAELLAVEIEEAIKKGNIEGLFKAEIRMSNRGYSWYPLNGEVVVAKTQEVIKVLKGILPDM